jgi:DNA (cytosine-5)-methyltransferase 1
MKPICFKIRGGVEREDGSRGSTNIGKMAGKGYLGAEDRAFTIATAQDQYLFAGQGDGSYTYPFNKPPMTPKKLNYLSLFSGIEAASVAWTPLGWECKGFAEIEEFPSAVLAHHYPTTKNYGDITKWKDWGLVPGSVNLVCAGSPCQAFSTAGLRKGLDDPRGNLALVTLGLVEHLQPKWFIWENVPGVLTSNGGRDFASLLTALGDIGYGWAYRVIDAVHFGVAQRRRRVWLVACRAGDWQSAAAVLFDSKSLCWDSSSVKGKGKADPSNAGKGVDENGLNRCVGAICADSHPGAYSGQDAYTGRLIPQIEPVVIDRAAYNQGVNAAYEPHIKQEDHMATLISKGPRAVGQPIAPAITTCKGSRGGCSDEAVAEVTAISEATDYEMRVRRLTERECERLQGFPDDYTKIAWNGKPADKCPAGLRYKAIGNSWAVPCARWIGERIQLVESIQDEVKAQKNQGTGAA